MEQSSVPIFPYVRYFTLINLVIVLAAVTLNSVFVMLNLNYDPGAGWGFILLSVAVGVVLRRFMRENKRIPNKSESKRLALGSFIASIITVLLIFLIIGQAVSGNMFWAELGELIMTGQLSTTLLIVILVSCVVQYLIIRLVFFMMAKAMARYILVDSSPTAISAP